jgi:hypothetical protein
MLRKKDKGPEKKRVLEAKGTNFSKYYSLLAASYLGAAHFRAFPHISFLYTCTIVQGYPESL